VPLMSLDAGAAAELTELLQFLCDWLACDPEPPRRLPRGLHRHSRLRHRQLRSELGRFAFLLGGSDGEPLFQPGQPSRPGQALGHLLSFCEKK
jgi:hypothetical protein